MMTKEEREGVETSIRAMIVTLATMAELLVEKGLVTTEEWDRKHAHMQRIVDEAMTELKDARRDELERTLGSVLGLMGMKAEDLV